MMRLSFAETKSMQLKEKQARKQQFLQQQLQQQQEQQQQQQEAVPSLLSLIDALPSLNDESITKQKSTLSNKQRNRLE
jgi:hypothetical protein